MAFVEPLPLAMIVPLVRVVVARMHGTRLRHPLLAQVLFLLKIFVAVPVPPVDRYLKLFACQTSQRQSDLCQRSIVDIGSGEPGMMPGHDGRRS